MKLTTLLKTPITEDVLERLGFSEYDDEHCTWGNRRLMIADAGIWPTECYKLQIIDYGDFPEENERPEGFSYQGWFELLPMWRTNDAWELETVKDIYKIIYLYHRQFLPEFNLILNRLK